MHHLPNLDAKWHASFAKWHASFAIFIVGLFGATIVLLIIDIHQYIW
jgi:hypothetical protein